jgi:hypothetical protein
MIGNLSKFGAVSVKVHALHGRMLSAEDYKHLASM